MSGNSCISLSRQRSAKQPATTTARTRPRRFNSSISRITASDSCRAASIKPQVLTMTRSASSGFGVNAKPSCANRPSMRSESTVFFAQPRLTKAKEAFGSCMLAAVPLSDKIKLLLVANYRTVRLLSIIRSYSGCGQARRSSRHRSGTNYRRGRMPLCQCQHALLPACPSDPCGTSLSIRQDQRLSVGDKGSGFNRGSKSRHTSGKADAGHFPIARCKRNAWGSKIIVCSVTAPRWAR
ncbi:hypothetical protein HRbin36_02302 [bacterium HR36]|nr:hypothetical protein HRbin36_02302 [bacterium HR36]